MRASFDTFLRKYGHVNPPKQVWQRHTHGYDDSLRRLGSESPSPDLSQDLYWYVHDLRLFEPYQDDLQDDLLRYVMPNLAKVWWDHLRTDAFGGTIEMFLQAIASQQPSDDDPKGERTSVLLRLSGKQREALAWFMRNAILDCLDERRGLAFHGMAESASLYRSLRAVMSYACTFPDINVIWEEWWSLNTPGLASSALCYASSLMYPDDANPVFSRWTDDSGGGPPCLWESDSFNSWSESWLAENIAFLEPTLTVDYLNAKVRQAAEVLANEPEGDMAARIAEDYPLCAGFVSLRIPELIRLLSTPGAGGQMDWKV